MTLPKKEKLYIVRDGDTIHTNGEAFGSAQVAIGIAVHAIGKASVAFGRQNYTSGGYSFAAGRENNVAQYGVAFGRNNKVYNTGGAAFGIGNQVDGAYGFATGNVVVASGYCSFAGGRQTDDLKRTIASADSAFAYGWGATASGSCSLAFGAVPEASGEHSVAIGFGNKANGNYSIALGTGSTSNSNVSFVFGGSASNVASLNENNEIINISNSTYSSIGLDSPGSIVLGLGSRVNAEGSAAIGKGHYIKAGAGYSMVLGNDNAVQAPHTYLFGSHLLGPNAGTTDSGENQKPKSCYSIILGKYNSIGDNTNYPIFAVGNGTSESNRKNAFEVFKNGDIRAEGNFYLTGGDSGRLILNEQFVNGEPTCFIRGAQDDKGGININNEIVLGHGTSTIDEELNGIPVLYPKKDDFGRLGYKDHPWKSIHVNEINGLNLNNFYMDTFMTGNTEDTASHKKNITVPKLNRAFFLVGIATNGGEAPALFIVNVNVWSTSSARRANIIKISGNDSTTLKSTNPDTNNKITLTIGADLANVFIIGSWC